MAPLLIYWGFFCSFSFLMWQCQSSIRAELLHPPLLTTGQPPHWSLCGLRSASATVYSGPKGQKQAWRVLIINLLSASYAFSQVGLQQSSVSVHYSKVEGYLSAYEKRFLNPPLYPLTLYFSALFSSTDCFHCAATLHLTFEPSTPTCQVLKDAAMLPIFHGDVSTKGITSQHFKTPIMSTRCVGCACLCRLKFLLQHGYY